MNDLLKLEHAAWRDLCGMLLARGAVTADDLNSSVSANATPGQRLLNAIRSWGAANVKLQVAARFEL